ncbi:MAG TPA: hypothetical protein PLW81_03520 [Thiobacillaceae bacterium]|nr:hypothetical protein [Thiobacillaceae bacterium]
MNLTATLDPATLARQFCGDTLRYRVQAEKTLAQEDLRVTVTVTAVVPTRDLSQAELDNRVRDALKAFLPIDWVFSHIVRQSDALGYERVTLRASGRAPAEDCYGLQERARDASRQGLSIEYPQVDYSLSNARMNQILQTLRLETLGQVTEQIPPLNQATGREWRIGDIEFGIQSDPDYERYINTNHRYSGKGAYRASGREDMDEEAEGLVGAERVILISLVTLRAREGANG